MGSIKSLAFVVHNKLYNLLFLQELLMLNKCWCKESKESWSSQHYPYFECTLITFVRMSLFLKIKECRLFHKSVFFWKRGCMHMHK